MVKLSINQSINQSKSLAHPQAQTSHQLILKEKEKGKPKKMSMSSSSTTLSLDQFPTSEQLCYVHCNLCDTVLAVSFLFIFHHLTTLPYIINIPSGIRDRASFLKRKCQCPFSFVFFFFWFILGECSLHEFIQDCNGSMWPLHQSPPREHAWLASAFG